MPMNYENYEKEIIGNVHRPFEIVILENLRPAIPDHVSNKLRDITLPEVVVL